MAIKRDVVLGDALLQSLCGVGLSLFSKRESGVIIMSVQKGSPAAMSGRLLPGDIILKVDGVPFSPLGLKNIPRDPNGVPLTALGLIIAEKHISGKQEVIASHLATNDRRALTVSDLNKQLLGPVGSYCTITRLRPGTAWPAVEVVLRRSTPDSRELLRLHASHPQQQDILGEEVHLYSEHNNSSLMVDDYADQEMGSDAYLGAVRQGSRSPIVRSYSVLSFRDAAVRIQAFFRGFCEYCIAKLDEHRVRVRVYVYLYFFRHCRDSRILRVLLCKA